MLKIAVQIVLIKNDIIKFLIRTNKSPIISNIRSNNNSIKGFIKLNNKIVNSLIRSNNNNATQGSHLQIYKIMEHF